MLADAAEPIIDTHIHIFDPTRKEGVPWPDKADAIYKPALPARYRKMVVPLGITAAVAVEASPWPADNKWLLNTVSKDPMIVGVVGNIEPGKPGFGKELEKLWRHRLFRGIRYGNIWDRDLRAGVDKPEVIADLKTLAQAELSMDSANPDPRLLEGLLRLSERVPNLRIVVDHLPKLEPWGLREMQELAKRPNVYVKVSGVLRRVDGKVPLEMSFYKDRLDAIWQLFGEDRLMYASDWPNSELWGQYPDVFRVVREYFATKSPKAQRKYFADNARKIYRLSA
jgi:predicted TIM-barrel fold metal-dependent hydrolase